MKKYTQIIEAYSYNELSDEAKQKAKDDYLEIDRTTLDFSSMLVDSLSYMYDLGNLKTYYSLSYSQGDGLCLCGHITHDEIFNSPKFRKMALKGLKGGQIKSVKENLSNVTFNHRGRYYYAESTTIEVHGNSYELTEKQYTLLEMVKANIKDWYLNFCNDWEKQGYKYFSEISDDDMIEISESNDYSYSVCGELLNLSDSKEVA